MEVSKIIFHAILLIVVTTFFTLSMVKLMTWLRNPQTLKRDINMLVIPSESSRDMHETMCKWIHSGESDIQEYTLKFECL